jgi:hypothetical protein
MADNALTIQLDLETGNVSTAFSKVEKGAKKAGETAGTSFAKSFGASLFGNIGADLFRDALRGIASEFGNIVNAGKNLEVIETQFRTILGSAKAAEDQLRDLQSFAATTPFQLEGLSLATRQLLSFGVASEDIIPTLRQIGDLAAGTGSRIDELTIPFGRLVSTQKLTLVELDKFADRGINLYGKLADQTGISLKEIRDAISKGKVPFEEFERALGSLTSQGGIFFQATQKQSKTLDGVLSTLGDNIFNLRANLGKLFSPLLIKATQAFTKVVQDFGKATQSINIDDIQRQFVEFNKGVINFLIMPTEMFLNAAKFAFEGVELALAGLVAAYGFAGGKIAEFLQKFGVDNELTQGLVTFSESSKEVFEDLSNSASASLSGIFDTPLADKAVAFNEELATQLQASSEVLDASLMKNEEAVSGTFNRMEATVDATSKAMGQIVKNTLAKGMSQGIQTIITSIGKGEDAFQNFGKLFLQIIGDMAIKLGETLILSGIGIESLKSLGGAAAIAAGAGLIAIGTIIKNASGGGGVPTAGGGETTGGAVGLAQEDDTLTSPDEVERATPSTNVQVIVEGSLVQQEELGTFITETLNESFGKQGVTLVDARFS